MITEVRNVFCFGGSIVDGYGASGRSWAHLLKGDYYNLNDGDWKMIPQLPQFHTMGVSSSTVEDICRQISFDVPPRLGVRHRAELPTLSILSIGHSDTRISLEDHVVKTPLPQFVRHIGDIARQFTKTEGDAVRKIMYVGLTACNEAVTYQRRGINIGYKNETLAAYEAAACEVFEDHGGYAAPLLEQSLAAGFGTEYLCDDGLHPDTRGQQWIHAHVAPLFKSLVS